MNILLTQFGYEVVTTHSVASALKLAVETHLDLYIIDSTFPDGTAIQFCREVRRFDANTPLIIYSGTTEKADLEEALVAGAQAYVLKPNIEELLETVTAILN
jgi:DNA-binding response OmpR family regulator